MQALQYSLAHPHPEAAAQQKAFKIAQGGPIIDTLFVQAVGDCVGNLKALDLNGNALRLKASILAKRQWDLEGQLRLVYKQTQELKEDIISFNAEHNQQTELLQLLQAAQAAPEGERLESLMADTFSREILHIFGLSESFTECNLSSSDAIINILKDIQNGGPLCKRWHLEEFGPKNQSWPRDRPAWIRTVMNDSS
ncbi:hypothetical protein IFR05_010206 [Cadophora sp. M221]|nr:hypothetical protein IFR05_010206 [Cadophora sp. M221]